jgi:hypothetical protein
MPSFLNTLRRCHSDGTSADEELRADLGFDRPSRARRAICASCAVRSSRVSTFRLCTVAPVASNSRRACSEALHAHLAEQLESDVQFAAGVNPAVRPPKPLAVQKVSAGELGPHPRATQMLDRLAQPALGSGALAQQA